MNNKQTGHSERSLRREESLFVRLRIQRPRSDSPYASTPLTA
jgi:hypothetical protein